MLIFISLILAAGVCSASSVEIRGSPLDTGDASEISWNATNWPAFYYSMNEAGCVAETLSYENTDSENPAIGASPTNNVMDKGELTYSTHPYIKKYMASIKTGVTTVNKYYMMPWFGQKYVAVDGDAQKITKLVLEQGGSAKKTLKVGESWNLGKGYNLTVKQLDLDGGKVWLALYKDEVELESKILSTNGEDDERTFVAKDDFAGKEDAVYFVTYVDEAFKGTSDCFIILKYTWLIDKDDITSIEANDEFGALKCTEVAEDKITLSNDQKITLEMSDTIDLTDDWYFKVSTAGKGTDGGYLFYPAKKLINPGTYEIRGSPLDTGNLSEISWNATNWSSFYYSMNEAGCAAETLSYENSDSENPAIGAAPTNNVMDKGELTYTTHPYVKKYMASTKTDATTVNKYYMMPWFGQKYVAVDGDAQKITKLVFEQKGSAEKTLKVGEFWELGKGYNLTVKQLDLDGGKVWLALYKDEVELESKILSTNGEDDERTFVAKDDFAGKEDAVYFVTYVDEAFKGTSDCFIILKYTWLIDKDDITSIEVDDEFGALECTEVAEDKITLSNDQKITLEMSDTIDLTDDWYFKVSKAGKGTDGGYLFYPAKKLTIEDKTASQEGAEEIPDKTETTDTESGSTILEDETSEEFSESGVEESEEFALKVDDETGMPGKDLPGFTFLSTISGLLAVFFFSKRR
ncbi:S-layer protein domain-containing protein [Methanococcoides sp. AM1]|uniref:S-layer protein domain-containing protein n=1 Tax=Methanococcoides sp. AM1 TaxID=1201011 RepID=UPI00108343EA|nr:S-layer protein domain-containing protein [Methanococcoides sp. AM1]